MIIRKSDIWKNLTKPLGLLCVYLPVCGLTLLGCKMTPFPFTRVGLFFPSLLVMIKTYVSCTESLKPPDICTLFQHIAINLTNILPWHRNIILLCLLDVANHLHGLAFFNVTRNQQDKIYWSQMYSKQIKLQNTHFINKIICLLKLINFLFTHLKLILMNSLL